MSSDDMGFDVTFYYKIYLSQQPFYVQVTTEIVSNQFEIRSFCLSVSVSRHSIRSKPFTNQNRPFSCLATNTRLDFNGIEKTKTLSNKMPKII